MPRNLTDRECKDILRRLGKRLNVEPRLIVTRLMNEEDKQDMREGKLPIKSLEVHIRVWMDNGMPDYAHGKRGLESNGTKTYAKEFQYC